MACNPAPGISGSAWQLAIPPPPCCFLRRRAVANISTELAVIAYEEVEEVSACVNLLPDFATAAASYNSLLPSLACVMWPRVLAGAACEGVQVVGAWLPPLLGLV